jgi:cytochrome bd-type quinol oxidase subunit 1
VLSSDSQRMVDHGTSRTGRWLGVKRVRISLWIAAIESLVVFFSHDVTRWTVIVLAIVAVICWFAGRESRSATVRHILWIFAASQLLTVIAVILGWIVKWAVIMVVVIFAILGLVYLFLDRR